MKGCQGIQFCKEKSGVQLVHTVDRQNLGMVKALSFDSYIIWRNFLAQKGTVVTKNGMNGLISTYS